MHTEATTFRPRNGSPAECYWRIRAWCERNGFTLSDVLNALMAPVAYHLENYSKVDTLRSKATVDLTCGPVDVLHVFNGKCYPLASSITHQTKNTLTLEDIEEKIAYWRAQNSAKPNHLDLMLLDTNPHAKAKLEHPTRGRRARA